MDFFQFLQKSTDDSDIKKTKRKTKTTLDGTFNSSNEEFVRQQGTYIDEFNVLKETNSREIEQNHLYIKRGDMVKIVNVPNSILNTYKGYIGEIKNYKKDQDFALVFLHGITSITIIKFPLLHLIKYNP